MALLSVAAINLFVFVSRKPDVVSIATTTDEHAFWQKIIEENPTYRDGYLVLYELEKQNGDNREQERLLGKAVNIDPFIDGTNWSGLVLSASTQN